MFKSKRSMFVMASVFAFILTATSIFAASSEIGLIVDGKEVKPDVSPQIVDGRVMVPIRWVSEALGAEVEWDEENRQVIVQSKNDSSNAASLKAELNEIPAPKEEIRFEDATDEEIISYIQEAGDWLLKSIFIVSPTSGKDKTEEEKQIIFEHLRPLFAEEVIADYFDRGYKRENGLYNQQEVDIQMLSKNYNEYEVNVEQVETGLIQIEAKAILNSPGIVVTHQSKVRYNKIGFVFEEFRAFTN